MILAIVRTIDTQSLVGVYATTDAAELRHLVDETCTPSQCEYASVPAGGFSARDGQSGEIFEPSALLDRAIHEPELLDWIGLDPENLAPGSQIDALLATAAGRELLARHFGSSADISLATMAA